MTNCIDHFKEISSIIDVNEQRWILDGQQLDDEITAEESHLYDGVRVDLILRLRGSYRPYPITNNNH
jgi:hypothetical protein